jgi:hypothetical protein
VPPFAAGVSVVVSAGVVVSVSAVSAPEVCAAPWSTLRKTHPERWRGDTASLRVRRRHHPPSGAGSLLPRFFPSLA